MDSNPNMCADYIGPLYDFINANLENCEDKALVTEQVRKWSYQYIKKSLEYQLQEKFPEIDAKLMIACAQSIEFRALRNCLSTENYTKCIVQEIESMENEIKTSNNSEMTNKILSVAKEQHLLLQINDENNGNTSNMVPPSETILENVVVNNPGNLENSNKIEYNFVVKSMEDMFGKSDDDNLVNVIFGSDQESNCAYSRPESPRKMKREIETKKFVEGEEVVQLAICRETMRAIQEINPNLIPKIMRRFEILFGEEDNSHLLQPLNFPEIKGVCKNRMTSFVIQSLTAHFEKHRFSSKVLFKILSRNLVGRLMCVDPLTDRKRVFNSIDTIFKKHRCYIHNQEVLEFMEKEIVELFSTTQSII